MRPDEFFSVLRPDFQPDPPRFFQNELVMEGAFWMIALVVTFILWKLRPTWLHGVEDFGRRLARRRGWTILAIVVASLSLRAVLVPWIPIPVPEVHDEYSYLLQAATFASGRVTNPTPAGWTHFETFHVNMRPTYQSMYPPGQAIFLAAAEVLHAAPWWGVWFSIGLMCGAICWMLQGWMPPQWALLGALFCVIRFSTFSYWVNSYFGGALAAAGGALVFGSLPRLKQTWKAQYGVVMVIGLGLMANTRAYEGFVLSIPALFAVLWWLLSSYKHGGGKFVALIPGLVVLLLIASGMGYYNWRNTGSALLLPYVVNQRDYHITKPFIWQARYPIPHYRHQVMRTFYVFHELPDYLNRRNPGYYLDLVLLRLEVYYDFYIWPLLLTAVPGAWVMMRHRKTRLIPCTILIVLAGLLIEQWPPEGHYAAPVLGVVIVAVLYGLRMFWVWRPKRQPLGPMLVRSVVILLLLWSFVPLGNKVVDPYGLAKNISTRGVHAIWMPSKFERSRLEAQLESLPGQHLIFVHFGGRELPGIFWIYNAPDIANAKIIWAYDMGNTANQNLIRLYPGRHLWIVDKTDEIMPLVPYHGSDNVADSILAQYKQANPESGFHDR